METHRKAKRFSDWCVWLVLTLSVLSGFISTNASAATRLSLLKQPRTTVTASPVILQGGIAGNCTIYSNSTSGQSSTGTSQVLYAHQETTTIGGLIYNISKLTSADVSGITLSADATTSGRKLMGKFVCELTGVTSIPASSWTIYYRVWDSTKKIVAHANIDVLARMSNGTIRTSIATMVANSSDLTSTGWSTLTGTYLWSVYTVTDQTDYLEIDYYVDVVSPATSNSVYLRIDDNSLAAMQQTSAKNIYLPNTYDYVIGVNNTVTDSWQVRLNTYSSSNISRLQNCIIYFHNSTGGNSQNETIVQNGLFIIQTGSWYSLGNSQTIYIAITVQANSTGASYLYTNLEVNALGTSTYAQYIIAFAVI